jgi:hypothetical protein
LSPAVAAVPSSSTLAAVPGRVPDAWRLSNGEVHFLWWFIQGSIMVPETRRRLVRGWGLCERHAWGALGGEASFRHGYLHGPCKLYEDLLGRARAALQTPAAVPAGVAAHVVARRLRERGPCLFCDCGLTGASGGCAQPWMVERANDPGELARFAARTAEHWRPTVCGRCAGDAAPVRCRGHFREDVAAGRGDVAAQVRLVGDVLRRLLVYSRSFVWGYHDTETDADRAALLSAVGWCSGWRGLFALTGAARDGAAAAPHA